MSAFILFRHAARTAPSCRYRAHFRWDHYTNKIGEGVQLQNDTEACASVTSAFLQVRGREAGQRGGAGLPFPACVVPHTCCCPPPYTISHKHGSTPPAVPSTVCPQILAMVHQVESTRQDKARNVLSILSTNTRRTKVVEMATGTHRVADDLRRHSLSDGHGGLYSTNLDRNRYGSDNNYLFTGVLRISM